MITEDQANEMLKSPHTTEVLVEKGDYPLSLLRHVFEDGTYLQEAWLIDEDGVAYPDYVIGKSTPNNASSGRGCTCDVLSVMGGVMLGYKKDCPVPSHAANANRWLD